VGVALLCELGFDSHWYKHFGNCPTLLFLYKLTVGRVKQNFLKMKRCLLSALAVGLCLSANVMAQVPSYVPTNGLVGYWPFNSNANDESGNGNNGTVNGATLTTDRFGVANKAYSFDGVNDFIEILNSASLNSATQSISISIWFNINNWYSVNNSGYFPIMSKSNLSASYGNYRNGLTISSSGIKGFYGTLNSDITGEDTLNFQLNNWNQIVYTINDANNSGSVYLNGILLIQGLTSYTGWSTTNTLPLIFGMDKPGIVDYANGKLDDIGIWNRALTPQEISDLYNANVCANDLIISPSINSIQTGNTANFTATTSDANSTFTWQSDFGQGFQTLNDFGNYFGTNTNVLSISNVQLANHNQPIRAISSNTNCTDTSNVATIQIADTCITTVYDTLLTTVTDTLIINTTLSLPAPNNENTILIYPNPASDHITIDNGNYTAMAGYTIKIENNAGQQVFQSLINQAQFYVDLSTWSGNGLYFVHLIDAQGNTVTVRKIVLQ
jgi:hypothetical protein